MHIALMTKLKNVTGINVMVCKFCCFNRYVRKVLIAIANVQQWYREKRNLYIYISQGDNIMISL